MTIKPQSNYSAYFQAQLAFINSGNAKPQPRRTSGVKPRIYYKRNPKKEIHEP